MCLRIHPHKIYQDASPDHILEEKKWCVCLNYKDCCDLRCVWRSDIERSFFNFQKCKTHLKSENNIFFIIFTNMGNT